MEPVVAGVLLCGGRSTRMGQDKGSLLLEGRTFLEHCCEQFSRFEHWCAVGANGAAKPAGIAGGVWLVDQEPDRGPLEGLAVGLSWVAERAEWAWVSTIDAPVISGSVVSGLCEIAYADPQVELVLPRVGTQIFPLTAVYRSSVAAKVRTLVEGGWRRVSDLPQHVRTRFVDEKELRKFDPELLSFLPVNRPDQYEEFLGRFGRRGNT